MGDFAHKDDRGSIFRNDRNTGVDPRTPTHKGDAAVVCPHCNKRGEHWINAWVNETKSGQKYFSLAFNPKEARPPAAESKPMPSNFDDDIPF